MYVHESEFETAVGLFFEAAATQDGWGKALGAVAHAAGALGANLIRVSPDHASAICSRGIEEYMDDVQRTGWFAMNPYLRRGMELSASGKKGLITSEDMLTPDEAARDPYINEHRIPGGLGPEAGVILFAGQDLVVPISLVRGCSQEPFSTREVTSLNRLMARLQEGAQLAAIAGLSVAGRAAEVMAGNGREVALLGASGAVLYYSQGLERHLRDDLMLRRGYLTARHGIGRANFSRAVSRALQLGSALDRSGAPVAVQRPGRRDLIVDIIPLVGAGQDVFMQARAIVVVNDPEVGNTQDRASVGLAAMGLSPAELRLALLLAKGRDLKAIADSEHIALGTARARLKSVFNKAGVRRQAELVSLIARIAR